MEPKQKILIVDDSEINRAMLKESLGEVYEYLEATYLMEHRTSAVR